MVVSYVVSLREWLEKITGCIQKNWAQLRGSRTHGTTTAQPQVLPNWGPALILLLVLAIKLTAQNGRVYIKLCSWLVQSRKKSMCSTEKTEDDIACQHVTEVERGQTVACSKPLQRQ